MDTFTGAFLGINNDRIDVTAENCFYCRGIPILSWFAEIDNSTSDEGKDTLECGKGLALLFFSFGLTEIVIHLLDFTETTLQFLIEFRFLNFATRAFGFYSLEFLTFGRDVLG